MYLEVIFPSKSYVLNHSESIDMHFEKTVLPYGRGKSEMSATISFFCAFPYWQSRLLINLCITVLFFLWQTGERNRLNHSIFQVFFFLQKSFLYLFPWLFSLFVSLDRTRVEAHSLPPQKLVTEQKENQQWSNDWWLKDQRGIIIKLNK